MTSWEPRSHRIAANDYLGSSMTKPAKMQAIHDIFAGAAHWDIDLVDTPTSAFTITPVDAKDPQQVNFRDTGAADPVVGMTPNGGITDPTAPGTPANWSGEQGLDDGAGNGTNHFYVLHEWEDAFWLFQGIVNYRDELNYSHGVVAGRHLDPFFESDTDDGMTGHVFGCGEMSIGNSGDLFYDHANGTTLFLADLETWEVIGTPHSVTTNQPGYNMVGKRVQPAAVIANKHPGGRPIGTLRYLFTWGKNYGAGDTFEDKKSKREAHFIDTSGHPSSNHIIPMQRGFDPALAPQRAARV